MAEPWSLPLSIIIFLTASLVTVVVSVRLARVGDTLADRTRLGEAVFGAVFFGAVVSLSGIVMTATAAWGGYPRMAYSNAVGGIAAQTAALGVADLAYRKANLEHAAASLSNLLFTTILIALLTIALLIGHTPDVTLVLVHPGSLVLVLAYLWGLFLVRRSETEPLWIPTPTRQTIPDVPQDDSGQGPSTGWLWAEFVVTGALVSAGGWAVARAAQGIVEHTRLDESVVGAVFMGLVNALPETITSVAAVRRGALTLAVGAVLGGNCFDVLNLTVGDVAFRGGSLHHAAGPDETFLVLVSILLATVLLAGMLRREREGPAMIGWESVLLLLLYLGTITLIIWG